MLELLGAKESIAIWAAILVWVLAIFTNVFECKK